MKRSTPRDRLSPGSGEAKGDRPFDRFHPVPGPELAQSWRREQTRLARALTFVAEWPRVGMSFRRTVDGSAIPDASRRSLSIWSGGL
jgi:hypothetical protein